MEWKASLKAAAVGTISGTAIGLIAFFFLTSLQHPNMGAVLFLLVPVAAGFSVVLVARTPDAAAAAAALLSAVCSLVLLVALGREGVLCALLAFPIIGAGLAIGAGIGILVRKLFVDRSQNKNGTAGILLLMGPILIFAGERIERPTLQHSRTELVQTTVELNEKPEEAWARILSIDSIQASKPILMYLGLPIPQRCTMQGRGMGAKRTCYFNVGYIEETVTEWNPPYYLGLSIDRTHMPGRYWLGFENAEYRLQPNGARTLLTRTTTISSHLHPAWYWRRFERLGVKSEHDYILREVMLRAQH
ncbi:MAG: hypothetical protein WBV69_22580 [Candidatus Sulfotelmatobacter sp.]